MPSASNKKEFALLKVGHCVHPEAVVLQNGKWRIGQYPSLVGLIRHPKFGYLLFDTGYAERFNLVTRPFPQRFYRWLTPMHLHEHENLLLQLQQMDIDATEIKFIFISHFHADHIAGLRDFSSARFICSRTAYDSFIGRAGLRGLLKGYIHALLPDDFLARAVFVEECNRVRLTEKMQPFKVAFDIFNDGSNFAVDLPGHAFGHIGLLTHSEGETRFLVGDACWSERAYKERIRPHRIAGLIMSDYDEYLQTLDTLAGLYERNKSVQIIPSHCLTTFERYRHA